MSTENVIENKTLDEIKNESQSQFIKNKMISNTKETIFELYHPIICQIEQHCGNLKNSQVALNQQLEEFFKLLRELKNKIENDEFTERLDENAKKITVIKRKLTLIHTIIQNSDDRCKKLVAKYGKENNNSENNQN